MKRLRSQPKTPAVIVDVVLFGLAFAVFALAGVAYRGLSGQGGASGQHGASGQQGRAVWWVLVLAAIIVAVLLPLVRPLTARVVHRGLYGERAAGYQVMADFMARMADTLEVDEVLPRLAETAARSLHSNRGDVTVWLADGRQWHQTWPPPPGEGDPGATHEEVSVEVHHHGDIVGQLGVGAPGVRLSGADQRVLADLAAPAGVALATVRLTVELRQRADQLADLAADLASCQTRIIDARRQEQRAILSRVRATVAPRLIQTSEALRAIEAALDAGTVPGPELEEARSQATGALDALRTVARGIFPAILTHAGLGPALRAWAESHEPSIALFIDGAPGDLHAHPQEEAALYYACVTVAEALCAPGRSAPGEPIRVSLSAERSRATLSVTGGGSPPDLPSATSQAIADRLGALGGTLKVARDPGGAIVAEVPLPDPDSDPVAT